MINSITSKNAFNNTKNIINCEVLIIGAGPAGSNCAAYLSEAGISNILIDKDKFPRDKPCGGALTTRIFKSNKFYSEDIAETIVRGGHLYAPDLKSSVKIDDGGNPVGYMTLRSKFDNYLVNIAKELGTKFMDGVTIEEISYLKDEVITRLEDETIISSKVVLGADGAMSMVARTSGLKKRWDKDEIGICLFLETEISEEIKKKYDPDNFSVHIHIGYKDLFGYFWTFYKKQHLNIGLGCLSSEKIKKKANLKFAFYDYLEHLETSGIIPKLDRSSLKLRGAIIPLKKPIKKTFDNRILLLGDASGFVNPLSGEGIYYAMASGKDAAKTIIDLKKADKDYTEKNLKLYEKIWKKDFGKELNKILFVRKFIMASATINNLITYAKSDDKFRNLIMKFMLGLEEIPRRTLASYFLKHVLKDLFRKFKHVALLDAVFFFKIIDRFYQAIYSILLDKNKLKIEHESPRYFKDPEKLMLALQHSRKISGKNSFEFLIQIIKHKIKVIRDYFRLWLNKK